MVVFDLTLLVKPKDTIHVEHDYALNLGMMILDHRHQDADGDVRLYLLEWFRQLSTPLATHQIRRHSYILCGVKFFYSIE